ncbi:MAG: glycoside hydrolase family 127 protein [Bacteroidales bacterium]|nr:glycoside hydrolase family 127 protein [Bacteroidales bacterium]
MKKRKQFTLITMALLMLVRINAQVIYVNNAGEQIKFDKTLFRFDSQAEVKLKPIPISQVRLLPSLFSQRYELNKKYLMSLENDKLLQNFYYEAGISKTGNIMLNKDINYKDFYWGWDSPMNQLRGHFLGHWLSAAAYLYAETKDEEVKAKADKIVAELAECQRINGGEWAGSIPEKYFDLMANGYQIWSPQYTIHKTLMGLWDMYAMTGSQKALEVLEKFADWFHRWTGRQVANNNAGAVYGGEACGMLEIWANLYGLTHHQKYLDLMERYGNPGLFQSLLKGEDALSNEHANASIPWSHGSARIYEVTGNPYWRNITLAFWKNAVDDRGYYCTGGQNAGEYWIPPHKLADFMCQNNQEHCTVYNMIRLASYLFRWTGEVKYADYIERNTYNGILAQQNQYTGMVAYFLPIAAGYTKGGEKGWGTPSMDFWCCHGTLVQAQTRYAEYIYFENNNGLVISQYIPSELNWSKDNIAVNFRQDFVAHEYNRIPDGSRWRIKCSLKAEKPILFSLQLRMPWWAKSQVDIKINGSTYNAKVINGYINITREWGNDQLLIEFPTRLYTEPLPGKKELYAFMEGPIVLAGIIDKEVTLKGDVNKPETMLTREYEHEYKIFPWKQSHYITVGQPQSIRFVPLYEITDERYTIYFPIQK